MPKTLPNKSRQQQPRPPMGGGPVSPGGFQAQTGKTKAPGLGAPPVDDNVKLAANVPKGPSPGLVAPTGRGGGAVTPRPNMPSPTNMGMSAPPTTPSPMGTPQNVQNVQTTPQGGGAPAPNPQTSGMGGPDTPAAPETPQMSAPNAPPTQTNPLTPGSATAPSTGSREDLRQLITQLMNSGQTALANQIQNILNQQNAAIGQQQTTFNNALTGTEQGQQTGGFNPQQLQQLQTELQKLESTGGMSPDQVKQILSRLTGQLGQAKTFTGTSGSQDPNQLNKILGGYGNLAATGGFNPQQENQFMEQATSGVPAVYQALEQQDQRLRNATGGLGTGGDMSQLARQSSEDAANATLAGKVNLNQLETQNRLAGLGGLESTESTIGGERLGALQQQGNIVQQQQALNQALQQGTLTGAQLQSALQSAVASGRLASNVNMTNLFNTTTGEVTQQGEQILQALGLNIQDQNQKLAILKALADPFLGTGDAFQLIGQVTQAAGEIGGLAAGISGLIPPGGPNFGTGAGTIQG